MNCEYCNTELSAGDISVIPGAGGLAYRVICPECEQMQSSRVTEENGLIYVITGEGLSD